MNNRFSSEYDPACAAALPNISAWVQQPNPDMQELVQLFLDQEWPIRAIVAGCTDPRCSAESLRYPLSLRPGATPVSIEFDPINRET